MPTESTPTVISELTTIGKIKDTSANAPFATDDDNECATTPPPVITHDNEPDPPVDALQPAPQRSTCVPIPTAKVRPDDAPLTHLKLAVQESRVAGDRLCAARTNRRQNNDPAPGQLQPPPGPAAVAEVNNDLVPDTVNLASIEQIEHLLAVAESLGDPTIIDMDDIPQTWCEAMASPYAKE
ncbi:hypothetical protein C0993_007107 [Termitomyces sp. T159_Od127]|nr:hypothetical protein C0993_007107 [Termitomyces sp. T159_Od127]